MITRHACEGMHPCILENFDHFTSLVANKRVVVFLDYDGTLTPIVRNPDEAFMSARMRQIVRNVGETFPTTIISGRGRNKVENFVQLPELFYAGSHGLDIKGPVVEETEVLPLELEGCLLTMMADVNQEAMHAVAHIPGATVEDNTFSVSVHFRNCAEGAWLQVREAVEAIIARHPEVHMTRGRKVLEIRPKVAWDKGRALLHLLEALGLQNEPDVVPIYIGDDRTDEDAFAVLHELGISVLVSTVAKPTAAEFTLADPDMVGEFLTALTNWGQTHHGNAWAAQPSCVGWMAQKVPGGESGGDRSATGGAAPQAALAEVASSGSISTLFGYSDQPPCDAPSLRDSASAAGHERQPAGGTEAQQYTLSSAACVVDAPGSDTGSLQTSTDDSGPMLPGPGTRRAGAATAEARIQAGLQLGDPVADGDWAMQDL